jgi:hypothetical protein
MPVILQHPPEDFVGCEKDGALRNVDEQAGPDAPEIREQKVCIMKLEVCDLLVGSSKSSFTKRPLAS